jgi:hypothetical protein
MAVDKSYEEKLKLLEQEMSTITEGLDRTGAALREVEDLKMEIRALKVFLEKHHPEILRELPGIIRKLMRV